jgi:hypothetical protein
MPAIPVRALAGSFSALILAVAAASQPAHAFEALSRGEITVEEAVEIVRGRDGQAAWETSTCRV